MVFGSGLLIMAFFLSGGQPILSLDDKPLKPVNTKENVAVKSATGSTDWCANTGGLNHEGTGSCGCDLKCPEPDDNTFIYIGCTREELYTNNESKKEILLCMYKDLKTQATGYVGTQCR